MCPRSNFGLGRFMYFPPQINAIFCFSFSDISASAIFFDGVKMVSGYLLMFIYTVLMLGRVNWIEHRFYLTAAGIGAVGMGLSMSIGLTSILSLPYTPMHAILPFLALGTKFVRKNCDES